MAHSNDKPSSVPAQRFRRSIATPSSQLGPRLFVSHSSKDNNFGLKLVQDLRHALGNDDAVWYDTADGLFGGDPWWSKIVQELTTREIFILVLSPDAMSSKWVIRELEMAMVEDKRIIPLLYRQCDVRADLKIIQAISFLAPKTYETAFRELSIALGLLEDMNPSATRVSKSAPGNSVPLSKPEDFTLEGHSIEFTNKRRGIQPVALSTKTLKTSEYPFLIPEGEPKFQNNHPNWLDWNTNEQMITIRNVGSEVALNIASVVYGCESYVVDWATNRRSEQEKNIHWTCWLGVLIAPGERKEAVHKIGNGIFYEKNMHIRQHSFNAPPEPRVVPNQNQPFITARITITYLDISKRKYASIFDYIQHTTAVFGKIEPSMILIC